MNAFEAAVTIECLRLWRAFIEDYWRWHPEEKPTVSVAEDAVYMSLHSEHRESMVMLARQNVSKMTKFLVQEYPTGPDSGTGWFEIYAANELEAAAKLAGPKPLRKQGRLGELRARVRLASKPGEQFEFYADLKE